MKKLFEGIAHFHANIRPGYRETFAKLALGQKPDCLFIGCSDSRVVPNLFASTDPGDLFVIRNPGNIVAPCGDHGLSQGDVSEGGALEFALLNLDVADIVVCGHSECGAMRALCGDLSLKGSPNLEAWLHHADGALKLPKDVKFDQKLDRHNKVSQSNALAQLENLRSYPIVSEREKAGKLRLHSWWFDIARAEVYDFEAESQRFKLIDEAYSKQALARYGL